MSKVWEGAYEIGDRVVIVSGEHIGKTGTITNITTDLPEDRWHAILLDGTQGAPAFKMGDFIMLKGETLPSVYPGLKPTPVRLKSVDGLKRGVDVLSFTMYVDGVHHHCTLQIASGYAPYSNESRRAREKIRAKLIELLETLERSPG